MERWLTVSINNKNRLRVKIAESGNFAFKEKYLVKKIELYDLGNNTRIPVDLYIKDKGSEDAAVILHKKIFLERNRSVFQFIDNLVAIFAAPQKVSVEVVINKTNDGINVGVLSARFRATYIHIPMRENAGIQERRINAAVEAKDLFLSNLSFFAEPIRKTWHNKPSSSDIELSKLWINCINKTKNPSPLLSVFESCDNNMTVWKNIVESWGLKMDRCKKYPYQLINKTYYDIISEEVPSAQYAVVDPCITLWTIDEGKNKEICILKGKVKLWQS